MKKRIISAILCIAMLSTMLMTTVTAEVDLSAGTIPEIIDNASLYMLCPAYNQSYFFHFEEVSENVTLTFYIMPGPDYLRDRDSMAFYIVNGDGIYDNEINLGGFETAYKEPANGRYYFMKTTEQTHNWTDCAGNDNVQAMRIDNWNRFDLLIDFDNKTMTGYLNYKLLETVPFYGDADSFNYLKIYPKANGYRPVKYVWMDNLILMKGLNAPTLTDLPSSITAERLAANKSEVLHCETFDSDEKYKYDENVLEPGWFCSTLGNEGFFKLDPDVGMTKYTVVKPVVEVEDNSSLSLLSPSRVEDTYRFGFGNIARNTTLTWYVKPSADYATDEDGFYYKLYNGETLVGGFDTNPTGEEAGQYLFMDDEEAAAKLSVGKWNRLDLVFDVDNNTLSGYVNYELVETVELSDSITAFDHLEIGSYQEGYKDSKRIFVDNVMLRNDATAPERTDVAANVTSAKIDAAKALVAFFPFNAGTEINRGTGVTEYKEEAVYDCRDDGGENNCAIDSTVGLVPQPDVAAFRGVQDTTAAGGDTFDVRLVGTTIAYYKVIGKMGFDVKVNGGKKNELLCDKVYDKLLGSENGVDLEYTALGDFGAGYIYAITLTGLEFDQTYTFEVTPFTYKYKGAKIMGETYTFVYENGVFSEVIPEPAE